MLRAYCLGEQQSAMASKRDYYEVLEVERGADQEAIKKAYRRLARQYHPDVNKEQDAEARFKEINEAYEVLSDEQKRAHYDRFGHAGAQGPFGPGGFEGFGVGGLDDLFESFFEGMTGARTRTRRGPQQGADLRYDLTLSFEEAIFGCEKELEVPRWETCRACKGSGAAPSTSPTRCPLCHGTGEVRRVQQTIFGSFVNAAPCDRCQGQGTIVNTPCPECRGQGKVRTVRRLAVKIPPGVDANTQIRLVGEGEPGTKGGPPGNLYVVLKVRKHRHFRRDGNDILYDLTINFAQAALGDEVAVPTVDGEMKLAIPPGTQYGSVLTVKGKGVPYLHSDRRGDQRVQVKIATPTRLTKEQKQLLSELARSLGKGKNVTPPKDKGFLDKLKDALEE